MSFSIGEIVQLNSGGPRMTVEAVEDSSESGQKVGVRCVWFDGQKMLTETFHPNTIKRFVSTQQRFAISDYDPLGS